MAAPQVPPGPGSDVDMDDASDASSDSFISDLPEDTTTSAETSDSDEGVDWSQVNPSFITTRDAIDALTQKRPIPRPPPTLPGSAAAAPKPSPFRPPPQRIPLNGLKTFVRWIPYWCDPEWNDERWKFEKDGQATEWVEVHPLDKQRPALLAKDLIRNATPWAKRFGIHADQLDGRSRMSPPLSDTRRVHLSYPVQTFTGMKEEITIEDVRDFLRKHPNNFATEEEFVKSIDQTANSELVYAYYQLQDLIEEDETWQRASMGDTTTEERIATGSHSLDPSPVTYDLDGTLHPLVRREKWMNQLDRGDAEDSPRLLYNLQGNRGEWTAHDENVWIAIQPALQIITRILNTKHPYWVALVHAESRREIDSSQLLYGLTAALSDNWTSFTTHYNPNSWPPDQLGAAHLNVLRHHGFDLPSAVSRFLKQRLRLCFTSVAVDWKKGAPVKTIHWGSCSHHEENDPSSVGIQLNIGAEIAFPLLVPDYTDKEKACCSMMLAGTILHELAHACIMGLTLFLSQSTLPIIHGPDSHLHNLHPEVMGALQGLDREINSRRGNEPYFEDQPVQECGFAFENVLFGGAFDSGYGQTGILYAHYNTFAISLTLGSWPWRTNPHWADSRILLDHPLPVTRIYSLLPTDTYTRFFSQSFWNSDLQKYGYEALKMHAPTNALTILGRGYQRKKDLRRVFGKSHAQWLTLAIDYLLQLGQGLLYAYCCNLRDEHMESTWVCKRFHHECKVWPRQTKIFDGIVDTAHRCMAAVSVALQDANSPLHVKVQNIDVENERNRQAYLHGQIAQPSPILDINGYCGRLFNTLCQHFMSLAKAYLEMHHFLLQEIRSLQALVVDYVEQGQNARQKLYNHYISLLYKKIEETYEPVVVESIKVLDEIQKQSMSGNFLTQELDDEIQRARNYLQLDLNHLAKTKFYMTEDNILVEKLLWVGDLESVPGGRKRQRSDDLKRMAMKELLRVRPEVRKLVETFAGILKVNIAGDDKEEERQQKSLSLLRINERIQKDLQANPTRQAMAAGPPGWLNPTPTSTPVQTGFQPPPQRSVQPWQAAPTSAPSAADRGVLFGQTSEITPAPPPPTGTRTPVSGGGGFGQYAAVDTAALFPRADPQAPAVFHNPNPDLLNMPLYNLLVPHEPFGGQPNPPPASGPFGTAWSDSRTVSEELHRQGIATPEFQGIWGRDVYLRRKAAEDAARLAAMQAEQARQQAERARQQARQNIGQMAGELAQRLTQTFGLPPFP